MTPCLWEFPVADFAAWCELTGETKLASHAEYMALLAAVQADQERQGREVRRVRMTVDEMRDKLADKKWDNTPDNRAAVIGLRGGE